ncbi:hypothetical protein [Streptomyces sp. NPDC088789]|uniref:hypothetical protein n=1 Tax=Streptomyces sp. NPDC088789 TaxID=3365899 RepID=UPI003822A33F
MAGAGSRSGGRRWRWATAVGAPVLLIAVAVTALYDWSEDVADVADDRVTEVPCAEALGFGGARLPEGAEPGRCTHQAFLDTLYTADFTMPRAAVREWLTRTYPQAEAVRTSCGEGVELCFDAAWDSGLPGGVEAHAVNARVTCPDARTARVEFQAFTT